jgi:hypothetical protein
MTHLSAVPGPYRRLAEQPFSVEVKICDGLFVKSMLVHEAGTIVPQHSHSFDHLSMLAVGRVLVWAGEECLGPFQAPIGILIKAGVPHTFRTLTDNALLYCIHRTDENGEVPIEAEHHLDFEE